MLQYSPWKIEQNSFAPEEEALIEEQLAFSNGYVSQYAFFEEHYSGQQHMGTFIEGVHHLGSDEPLCIPNLSAVSVRLGEERLDLNVWTVKEFYRCLYKGEARLERHFIACSPQGHTIEVSARRILSKEQPNMFREEYEVKSIDYAGPITLMTLLGDNRQTDEWYPLQTSIDEQAAYIWTYAQSIDIQICAAQTHQSFKNGSLMPDRPIKIDKKHVLGYAYMQDAYPGDRFSLVKTVAIVDSRSTSNKDELPSKVLELLNASTGYDR